MLIDKGKLLRCLQDHWLATSPNDNDSEEVKNERAAMCRGIDDVIGIVYRFPETGGWISVKERLPESSGIKVIVSAKTIPESVLQTKAVFVAFLGYGDGKWYTPDVDFMASEKTGNNNVHPVWEITHWRFPPEPSKEEE